MMFSSLLFFYLALLVENISAFGPNHIKQHTRNTFYNNDVKAILPTPRQEKTSLFVVAETGLDAMTITMLIGAGLLARMAEYTAKENEDTTNSSVESSGVQTKVSIEKGEAEKTETKTVVESEPEPTIIPVQTSAEEDLQEPEETADELKTTPILVKMMGKLVMPWKKFSNI